MKHLVAILVFAAIFLLLIPFVGDNDVWLHLRAGEYQWQEQTILQTDVFSYTIAGIPWINHEWLAQLMLYGTYRIFGFTGLGLLAAFVGTLIFFIFFKFLDKSSWFHYVLFLSAAYVLQQFFPPRPQIFAYLLLTLLLYALRKRKFWALPCIMLIWANVHASVLIGAIILIVFFITDRSSWKVVLGSLTVSFINPFTYHLYTYALQPFRHQAVYQTLIETRPLIAHLKNPEMAIALLLHAIFLAVVITALVQPRTRKQLLLFEYLLVALAAAAPFFAVKYLPFAWIIMMPPVLKCLPELPRIPSFWKYGTVGALSVASLFISVPRANLTADPHSQWPRLLINFMDVNNLDGPLYHSHTWGGYLAWERKNQPIFIHGVSEAFYDAVYFDALDMADGKRVDELIEKYHFSTVLARPWEPLAYVMSVKPDWVLVYWDNFGMIYAKRTDQHQELVRSYGMNIPFINDSIEGIFKKIFPEQIPLLMGEYQEAIRRQPDLILGHFRLGQLHRALGQDDLAAREFLLTKHYQIDERFWKGRP